MINLTLLGEKLNRETSKEAINAFDVQVIGSLKDLDLVTREWNAFHHRSIRQNLLHDAQNICIELARHSERYSPLCVVLRRHEEVKCIAPFFVDTSSYQLQCSTLTLVSIRTRLLRLFGNDFMFNETADYFDCIAVVFDKINKIKDCFDIVYLECLETSSPLWKYCYERQRINGQGFHTFSGLQKPDKIYKLKMAPSHDEWWKSLPRKRRQTFSWQGRKFKEAVKGPVRLWSVKDEGDVPPFLEALDKLFPVTWQAKTFGIWKRDSFKEIEYFTSLARAGILRAYMLLDGTRAVAFLVGYQHEETYYYEEIGYDPQYAHLGPGGVLNTLFIEELYEMKTPKLIDFGFGENTYKKVLSNLEVEADRLYVVGIGKWFLLMIGQRMLLVIYSRTRDMIKDTRVERWLKRLLKRL
jgi:hypothetical protein